MKDQELRYLVPSRIRVGPFEEFEVVSPGPVKEADVAEVDRDAAQGWLWLVQRKRLASRRALTFMARVRRPGASKDEKYRLVLVCDGGTRGATG